MLVSGTPFEKYIIEDGVEEWPVWVKRDDLCANPPAPRYAKIRGLVPHLKSYPRGIHIGVQDAGVYSRSGWAAAYVCKSLKLHCHTFYPVYKAEYLPEDIGKDVPNHNLRVYQLEASKLGSELHPQRAGRASILWHQARKVMEGMGGVMLPAGLRLKESMDATAEELIWNTPNELMRGTWISAISSGTMACGILSGMHSCQEDVHFICYMGSSKNEAKTRKYMCDMVGYEPDNLTYVDEGWKYSDAETRPVPFPASQYYEAKAWHWLMDHVHELEQPIVFWNIGD